jgi:hypothetical protein
LYALLNMQLRRAFLHLIPEGVRKCLSHEKFAQFGTKSGEKSLHRLLAPTPVPAAVAAKMQNPAKLTASIMPSKHSAEPSAATAMVGGIDHKKLYPMDIHL